MKTKLINNVRAALAFTLIEMLTVIAIIAILAAMVVSMGKTASQKKKIAMVTAQKIGLVAMIDNYHTKLNYYPPDNGNLASANLITYDGFAATNPLLYELTGGTNLTTGRKFGSMIVFNSPNSNTTLPGITYANAFNRGGIANADPTEPHDFFQPGPKPNEIAYFPNFATNPLPVCGLIVPVPLYSATANNFWHYDSSSTNRHNLTSFDIWAEYSIGSKNGQPIIVTNGNF